MSAQVAFTGEAEAMRENDIVVVTRCYIIRRKCCHCKAYEGRQYSKSRNGVLNFIYVYIHICIKGSGTYPCTLLSKRFLKVEKHQEKHKCISKDGVFCCGYSGLFLSIFTDEAVTTSAGRSFHIFTLWLKVNLRRSSLDRSFRSFSGCPRSRGVSHLEEVLPLNALQEAMGNFIDQYHVSLVHPTSQ